MPCTYFTINTFALKCLKPDFGAKKPLIKKREMLLHGKSQRFLDAPRNALTGCNAVVLFYCVSVCFVAAREMTFLCFGD